MYKPDTYDSCLLLKHKIHLTSRDIFMGKTDMSPSEIEGGLHIYCKRAFPLK